jgi:hypothetical protein
VNASISYARFSSAERPAGNGLPAQSALSISGDTTPGIRVDADQFRMSLRRHHVDGDPPPSPPCAT